MSGSPNQAALLRASVGLCALACVSCSPGGEATGSGGASSQLSRPGETTEGFSPTASLPEFFTCMAEAGAGLVSAHRGGSGPGRAENALASLELALKDGALILEVDVRPTRDGALVLMHDDTLERTTSCSGFVIDTALEDVRACGLRDPRGRVVEGAPPTLVEALEWAKGRAILQLDIKRETPFQDVVDAVRLAGADDHVVLITYSLGAAKALARLAPDLMISVPISGEADLTELARAGLGRERVLAWGGVDQPDPALAAELGALKVEYIFGTLGAPERSLDGAIARSRDEATYARLVAEGVDVIATDRHAQAAEALRADSQVDEVDARRRCARGG